MFQVNDRVRLVRTGKADLNQQTGTVVGYHGFDFPIVQFDTIPFGYNPVICIIHSCLEPE
jgi:hypothetical protein